MTKSKESKTVLNEEDVKKYMTELEGYPWTDFEEMMTAVGQFYVLKNNQGLLENTKCTIYYGQKR